jgi:carbonic anhydrase
VPVGDGQIGLAAGCVEIRPVAPGAQGTLRGWGNGGGGPRPVPARAPRGPGRKSQKPHAQNRRMGHPAEWGTRPFVDPRCHFRQRGIPSTAPYLCVLVKVSQTGTGRGSREGVYTRQVLKAFKQSSLRGEGNTEMYKPIMLTALMLAVTSLAPANGQEHKQGGHWSYEGAEGPDHWGDLSASFDACKTGKEQSPINIGKMEKVSLPAIQFDYKASPLAVVDNGHTIQVNYAPGSSIEVGGHRYELKQFHFHHPSENEVAGKPLPLELHLVHADADGKLAVVGVLISTGAKGNSTLQSVWDNLPKDKNNEAKPSGVTINAADLLPKEHAYYTFPGSLTTPPCSEGVTWLLLKAHGEVSAAQLNVFAKLYPHNARPVQQQNARVVRESN